MHALVLACLVVLACCIIDNDPVRVENFTAETPTTSCVVNPWCEPSSMNIRKGPGSR